MGVRESVLLSVGALRTTLVTGRDLSASRCRASPAFLREDDFGATPMSEAIFGSLIITRRVEMLLNGDRSQGQVRTAEERRTRSYWWYAPFGARGNDSVSIVGNRRAETTTIMNKPGHRPRLGKKPTTLKISMRVVKWNNCPFFATVELLRQKMCWRVVYLEKMDCYGHSQRRCYLMLQLCRAMSPVVLPPTL